MYKLSNNPALILNNMREKRGEEWVLRFFESVVIHRRKSDVIGNDLGLCSREVNALTKLLFDKHTIDGETCRTANAVTRTQLNEWEEYRRKRFETVLDLESWIRSQAENPASIEGPMSITSYPGLTRAFNDLRERMGDRDFKTFLHYLRSDKTPTEIEERFKRYDVKGYQCQLWRKVVTRKTRALISELSKIVNVPLTLVTTGEPKAKKERARKGAVAL